MLIENPHVRDPHDAQWRVNFPEPIASELHHGPLFWAQSTIHGITSNGHGERPPLLRAWGGWRVAPWHGASLLGRRRDAHLKRRLELGDDEKGGAQRVYDDVR